LIEELAILTLHDLKAAAQVGRDPTTVIIDAFWHEAAVITESPVHRNWISTSKCFDDHVQHRDLDVSRRVTSLFQSLQPALPTDQVLVVPLDVSSLSVPNLVLRLRKLAIDVLRE
jgi:hypothetical protein